MDQIRPLPRYLVQRYLGWKATTWDQNKAWYRRLAADGQRPRIMAIACCDSRVRIAEVFGADAGEIFIHRNVANLVPPCAPDGGAHGTSAAVDYAVRHLRVAHLLVLGHSGCGGVAACAETCREAPPEREGRASFVDRWMEILRPGWNRVAAIADPVERLRAFERAAVEISLRNLLGFPFVAEAVAAEDLQLHGLWHDIAAGTLHQFLGEGRGWVAL